ncbi:MAG TPA: hypothetical protein VLV32_04230 [Burkholderiales bacterium]|nr:hypothetical protein [Burkholderiales bacterium]
MVTKLRNVNPSNIGHPHNKAGGFLIGLLIVVVPALLGSGKTVIDPGADPTLRHALAPPSLD